MENLKERIQKYYEDKGFDGPPLLTSVGIAEAIARYAHERQYRENGEIYFNHPGRLCDRYRDLVGIYDGTFDYDLIWKAEIPYEGVQEVCLLHDVLEDTKVTMEEIEELYEEQKLGIYFRTWIKEPLKLITHIKTEKYWDYLKKVAETPVSILVKMLDLDDNLKVTDLKVFGEVERERCHNYIEYYYALDKVLDFHNKLIKYKELLASNQDD